MPRHTISLGQTHTGPLRQLGIACRPWRLRNHHHRPACRYRTGAPDRSQPAAAGRWIGIRHGGRCGDRGVGCHPAVPAQRPRHDHAGAAGVEHTDVCGGQPVDPGRPAGQLGSGHPAFRLHRGDVTRRCRRGVGSARRPVAAFDPAIADVGAGGRRRVQPLPAQRDAGCPRPGFHSHRPRQGADPTTGPTQAWPANGANTDGHAVRLRGGRVGHRSGFRREDLRLARHG